MIVSQIMLDTLNGLEMTVVYLASDQSVWVSGIILSIDAGSMAGTVGNTTPPRAFE